MKTPDMALNLSAAIMRFVCSASIAFSPPPPARYHSPFLKLAQQRAVGCAEARSASLLNLHILPNTAIKATRRPLAILKVRF